MKDAKDYVNLEAAEAQAGGRLVVIKLPMTASLIDYNRAQEIAVDAADALATQGVVKGIVLPMDWEIFLLPQPTPAPSPEDPDITIALEEE